MSSGNGPPSFPNGTNNSSYVYATDDPQVYNNQPPSYDVAMGRAGNSVNQFQNASAYRDLGPTDTPKPPSFTTALERERNSHAYTGNLKYESGNVGVQPPSLSGTARGNYSNPSGGGEHEGSAPAPNMSDANRRPASHPGDSSMVIEGSDAQDYVGMSLVGKNFRRFYPNAYYKGKDADN